MLGLLTAFGLFYLAVKGFSLLVGTVVTVLLLMSIFRFIDGDRK